MQKQEGNDAGGGGNLLGVKQGADEMLGNIVGAIMTAMRGASERLKAGIDLARLQDRLDTKVEVLKMIADQKAVIREQIKGVRKGSKALLVGYKASLQALSDREAQVLQEIGVPSEIVGEVVK